MIHKYFVYIVSNNKRSVVYTGVTKSLTERTRQHERGERKGFSKKYNCTDLIYYESFQYIHEAIKRENQIKKYSRKKKDDLIQAFNPRLKTLNKQVYLIDKRFL